MIAAMRRLALIGLAGLAGCSRPAVPPGADLAQAIAGRTAGPPQSCVHTESSSGLHAIDESNIGYGSGRTIYVNHLGGACPGLRELSTIIIEAHGSEYCRGDRFRSVELAQSIPGPTCILQDWVPYRRP
jgi:hypothetical protein